MGIVDDILRQADPNHDHKKRLNKIANEKPPQHQAGAGSVFQGPRTVTVDNGASNPAVVDTELPAAVALSDTLSNPTTPMVGSSTLGWQATSSQWGRVHAHKFTSDGVTPSDHLGLIVGGPFFVYNGTTLDRARGNTTGAYMVPMRQSSATGRTYKTADLAVQTADALLYTVTNGKTLYVTSLHFAGFNTSTATTGDVALRDGTTAAGTRRQGWLMTAAGVAAQLAASAAVSVTQNFPEPLQFTSGMFIDIVGGTITYSVSFVGYEE